MKMGLLKSVSDVPGIDFYDYRESTYYNKYQYRARFNLFGVRYTWYSKNSVDFIRRINNTKKNGYLSIRKDDRAQILANIDTITSFIDWRDARRLNKEAAIRIEGNTVSVFCDDLSLLQTLPSLGTGLEVDYTQVKLGEFIGTKYFVNKPKHKFRVYLKSKRVEAEFAIQMSELLQRNNSLYPSPALRYWIAGSQDTSSSRWSWRYRYSNASHFIDYDDESVLSYLSLIHGEMLGKRYRLEKRPEPV